MRNFRLRKYLYKSNSNLPILVLLITIKFELEGKELTFKELKNSLYFSENAMRNSLRRLNQEKLILILPSKKDRRNKLIIPSQTLLTRYQNLLNDEKTSQKK